MTHVAGVGAKFCSMLQHFCNANSLGFEGCYGSWPCNSSSPSLNKLSFTVCSTLLLLGLVFFNFPSICQRESQSCVCCVIAAVRLIYSIGWVSYGVTCRIRSHAAQLITGWLSSNLPSGQREVSCFNKLRNTRGTTTFQYQINSSYNKNNTDLATTPTPQAHGQINTITWGWQLNRWIVWHDLTK